MFENEDGTKVHTRYYLLKVKIKNFKLMIDGKNVFHRSVKSEMKTYDNNCWVSHDPKPFDQWPHRVCLQNKVSTIGF